MKFLQTPPDLDNLLSNWTSKMNAATGNNIPILKYRNPPGVRPTDSIKHLQQQKHEIAYNNIKHAGPLQFYTNILKYTRHKIGDAYRDLQTHIWNQILPCVPEIVLSVRGSINRFKYKLESNVIFHFKAEIGHHLMVNNILVCMILVIIPK